MQLHLSDPAYTDRLAAFLQSLGQTALVNAPDHVELADHDGELTPDALRIYLRMWRLLYPDADVDVD